ncbi:MAG TPA: ETEC_3214 domain-containing protein [Ornithinibacter sp.]|nr:ETEC_3214 domain-containing protein [Ornithinibacter sp.]
MVVIVAAVLAVVTSLTTAWALLGDTADFVDDLANPHGGLYGQVDLLKLDVTSEYVDRVLGPPASVMTLEATCDDCGALSLRVYALEKDATVRALFEGSALRMFLVTRVDTEVRPTIRWREVARGELGETSFAEASRLTEDGSLPPTDVSFWPGAQRINYVEVFALGAPGKYEGLILGHSSEGASETAFDLEGAQDVADAYSEAAPELSGDAVRFRDLSEPNTFGAFRDDGPVANLVREADFVNGVQTMGEYG